MKPIHVPLWQAVNAVELLMLLFNWMPVLGMLRSERHVVYLSCLRWTGCLTNSCGDSQGGTVLNKVAKAERLVWVINLRLIHLHRRHA